MARQKKNKKGITRGETKKGNIEEIVEKSFGNKPVIEEEAYKQPKKTATGKSTVAHAGIAALIVIIILAAVWFFANGGQGIQNPPNNGTIVPPGHNNTQNGSIENKTEICNDECLYAKALSEKQSKYCDWILNDTRQDGCYKEIANYSLDACLKVKEKNIFDNCVLMHAISTNDILLCEKLSSANLIQCKRTIDSCYFLDGTEFRICLAQKKNNATYCENDDDCLFNYSIGHGDASVCSAITSPAQKQACKSILNNGGSCDDVELPSQKEYCWELYAIYTDNLLMCSEITTESQYQLECLSHFTVSKNDLSVCDSNYLELDNLWKCYIAYSVGTGNISGCDKINRLATTNMFNCYFEYAKKYGNPHACDMMDNPAWAETCYIGVILNNQKLNYTYCDDVAKTEWRNKCYIESAKINRNVGLCDYIPTEAERNGCINAYNLYIASQ